MVCMHLTNYAVNKNNSNFQQPTAKSTEEAQDEGSKRSLAWFMNWIREEKGDAKADWLWRRMGASFIFIVSAPFWFDRYFPNSKQYLCCMFVLIRHFVRAHHSGNYAHAIKRI